MNYYKTKYKNVSIDFDGVIHSYSKGYQDGRPYDEPKEGAIDALVELHKQGMNIIILTARPEQDFPLVETYIRGRLPEDYKDMPLVITNQKYPCVAYIDDRAIHFTNWEQTMKDLVKQVGNYISEHASYGETFKEEE